MARGKASLATESGLRGKAELGSGAALRTGESLLPEGSGVYELGVYEPGVYEAQIVAADLRDKASLSSEG